MEYYQHIIPFWIYSVLKIIYLAQRNPYPHNKGGGIRTYYQIKHLVEQGQDLTLLCQSESGQELDTINEIKDDLVINADSCALLKNSQDVKMLANWKTPERYQLL